MPKQTDAEPFVFGPYRGTLFRRADVKVSSWFFRMYLKDEDRHLFKSLKTDDVRHARELAAKEIVAVLARMQAGERILAVSLSDLQRKFDLHQEALVERGELSPTTLSNHNTRYNHGMRFLESKGKDRKTRVSGMDGNIWNDYLAWRFADAQSRGKTIRRDVVRDELLTIRKMYLFAKEQKLCTDKAIPRWNFTVEKEGPKRERMTQRDYTNFLGCIHRLVESAKTERERYNRLLLRHFALIVANSGMRSGELFGLKNKDVTIHKENKECVVFIRKETSKVRTSRTITIHGSYGGNIKRKETVNYLIRWMTEHSRHREPNNFVFSTLDGGKKDARDVYYHQYKVLREELKKINLEWFDTYHCRHFWITNRLYAGEPIHLVAKAAGTSVAEIEETYSHVLTDMATKQFNKRQVQYNEDGSFEVVDTPARKKIAEKTKRTKPS